MAIVLSRHWIDPQGRETIFCALVTSQPQSSRPLVFPYIVTIDQNDVYFLRNSSAFADLSGTRITSDKPVAVFIGNKSAYVPVGFASADQLIEHLTPTSIWGQDFVTYPLATRSGGDTFRVLASMDNTEVSINGTLLPVMNQGDIYETLLSVASVITSNNPILVMQYANSATFDPGVDADPFMAIVPPINHFQDAYTVKSVETNFSINYLNVIAPASEVGSIILDGTAIPAASLAATAQTNGAGHSAILSTVAMKRILRIICLRLKWLHKI